MNTDEKTDWLAGLLRGWGIRESWAKIIAGAVIGALAAAGLLASTGCSASYTQEAGGRICATVHILPLEAGK